MTDDRGSARSPLAEALSGGIAFYAATVGVGKLVPDSLILPYAAGFAAFYLAVKTTRLAYGWLL